MAVRVLIVPTNQQTVPIPEVPPATVAHGNVMLDITKVDRHVWRAPTVHTVLRALPRVPRVRPEKQTPAPPTAVVLIIAADMVHMFPNGIRQLGILPIIPSIICVL